MREGQDTIRETETAGEGVPETGAVPPEDGPDAWGPRYGAEASWDEGSGIWVVRVPGLDVQVEGESREAALLLAEEAVEARLAEMPPPEAVPDGELPGDAPSGTEGPSDSGELSGAEPSPGTGGPEETDADPDSGEPSGEETDEGSDGGEASGMEEAVPDPDPYGGETLFSPRIAALVLGVVAVVAGILRWLDIG